MYDYATATQQIRILQELEQINNNLISYTETFSYLIILFIICFLSFCVYRFVLRCLGK